MGRRRRKCSGCGAACFGERCRACDSKVRERAAPKCGTCSKRLRRKTMTGVCRKCAMESLGVVLKEEAVRVPNLPPAPRVHGDAVVITDPHVPFHNTAVIMMAAELAQRTGIKRLIIAGDYIDAAQMSKYQQRGRAVPVTEELLAMARALEHLRPFFDEIHLVPGNHDQRVEKDIATIAASPKGSTALELLKNALGAPLDSSPGEVAVRYLEMFLKSPGVHVYELPRLILNDHWLIQHPKHGSAQPPSNERKMCSRFLMSVIQGHNHQFGLGFDPSGTFVAYNMGPACDDKNFRYKSQDITPYPKAVGSLGVIYKTNDCPEGRLWPIVMHPKMSDPFEVFDLMQRGQA